MARTKGLTAWALLVVSSEQQAETLVHQRVWAQRTAEEKGWQLTRCLEGVSSGRDGARQLTQRLVSEVRDAAPEVRPQYVLMIRLDRVGRGSIVETQLVVRDLRVLGAAIFTRDQGEVKMDSAMDELIAAVQLAVGRHENEVRRDKAAAIARRKRAAGLVLAAIPPYGLQIVNGLYEAAPGQAEAMQHAFRMRAAGAALLTICLWLQANAPPRRFKNGRIVQPRWATGDLHRILHNPAYNGTIIDQALYARSTAVRKYVSRGAIKANTRGFPLSSVIRCGCGHPLNARAVVKKRHEYYLCNAHWSHAGKSKSYRAEILEEAFVGFLFRLRDNPQFALDGRSYSTYGRNCARLQRILAQLELQGERLEAQRKRVWTLESMGRLTIDDLEQRLADITNEAKQIERASADLREQVILAEASRLHVDETREVLELAAKHYVDAEWTDQRRIAREVATALGGIYWDRGTFRVGQSLQRIRRRRANVHEKF